MRFLRRLNTLRSILPLTGF
uniref:Uncharacterized protein n=1 Tax=Anguilla anguilla TaxID=7936 RepID=A0A0E9VIZ3_ANGAN